jgi:hypothetical protein
VPWPDCAGRSACGSHPESTGRPATGQPPPLRASRVPSGVVGTARGDAGAPAIRCPLWRAPTSGGSAAGREPFDRLTAPSPAEGLPRPAVVVRRRLLSRTIMGHPRLAGRLPTTIPPERRSACRRHQGHLDPGVALSRHVEVRGASGPETAWPPRPRLHQLTKTTLQSVGLTARARRSLPGVPPPVTPV